MTAATIFIIAASYSQIIELFPTGGGGYLVASKLLSPMAGMVSGSALLIDYVLTITISVASGADALFSFLPAIMAALQAHVRRRRGPPPDGHEHARGEGIRASPGADLSHLRRSRMSSSSDMPSS